MQFALPYPVDQMIVVPVGRTQSLTSNTFTVKKTQMKEVSPFLKPGVDGYLLTADRNIVHCASTLKYQVEDINSYLFSLNRDDREALIGNLLDNSILKSVAQMTLEDALNKKNLIAESKLILQKQLNEISAGVRVELLDLAVSVPLQVKEITQEVLKAGNDADNMISEAEKYVRQTADKTENDIVKIKYSAEIWKTRMMGRAQADLKTFEKLLADYRKNPEQVKSMLLRNAMSEVSGQLEEIFVFDGSSDRELRIQMSRQPVNEKTKADEEK
jgi:membrane protease subunit HflK